MRYPFLFVLVCFAAGILAGGVVTASVWLLIPAILCAGLAHRSGSFAIALFSTALFLFLLGIEMRIAQETQFRDNSLRKWVAVHEMEATAVKGTVMQTPEIADDFFILRLRVHEVAGATINGVARITVSGASQQLPVAGDSCETFARFRLPVNFGTEGSFDYERYLQTDGIHVLGTVKSASLIRCSSGERSIASEFSALRLRLVQAIIQSFPPTQAGLLRALWLDDRAGLQRQTEQMMVDAGIYHVIAISGFHVAVLLAICFFFLKRFISYRKALLLLCLVLIAYFLLLEGRSSITRSLLLFLIFTAASLRYERVPWGNALSLAAFLQLAWNPLELFDSGFRLTYLSTATILFVAVPVCSRIRLPRKIYQWIFDFAATTLSIEFVLAPYQALTFHKIPFGVLLANAVAIPLSSVLIAAGTLVIPMPGLLPWLSRPLSWLLSIFTRSAGFFSGVWLRFVAEPTVLVVILFYLTLILALSFKRPVLKVVSIICCATLMLVVLFPAPRQQNNELRVHVIDVGQGDSILVQYPDGSADLVDGGGFWNSEALDVGEMVLLPYLSHLGITRLHRVFLTHAHADHMNGLFAVFRYIPVDQFCITRRPLADAGFQALIIRCYARITGMRRGMVLKQGNVQISVLAPADCRNTLHVANDDSLVLLLSYEGKRVLLTGDAEAPTENQLLGDLRADILKVPHHGSKTSSTAAFLARVRPKSAIVSVGRNNWFGHPNPEVVARYRAGHSMVYRTDWLGTIVATVSRDGTKIEAYAWK